MNHWEHISDVHPEIRQTMASAFAPWEKQDLGVEAMVDGMYQAPRITRATVQTLQETANSIRVPELVRIVKAAHKVHPGTKRTFTWRDAFKASALFCGLHARTVQKLYYLEAAK